MKKFLSIILFFLVSKTFTFGQTNYYYFDNNLPIYIGEYDNFYDIYQYSNPAWNIYNNDKLISTSRVSFYDIKLRRKYDPREIYTYQQRFDQIKHLSKTSVFKGTAIYNYTTYKNKYRSLLYNPYLGDAFNFADTTSADVNYKGPLVNLLYSFTPLDKITLGANLSYKIKDGLKTKYTYGESDLIDMNTAVGMIYNFSKNFNLGFSYKYNYNKEKIKCSDVNLLSVETYLFRGEIYKVLHQDMNVGEERILEGNSFSVQNKFYTNVGIDGGFIASYQNADLEVTIPNSTKKVIEGKSSFEKIDISFNLKKRFSTKFSLPIDIKYIMNKSWSLNPANNRTIWEWETYRTLFSVGFNYIEENSFYTEANIGYKATYADSSKYMEGKFSENNYNTGFITLQGNKILSRKISLGCKFLFQYGNKDFFTAAEEHKTYNATITANYNMNENILFKLNLYYYYQEGLLENKKTNNLLGCYLTIFIKN